MSSLINCNISISNEIIQVGRSIGDQFITLWASWSLEQIPYDYASTAAISEHDPEKTISKVWFGAPVSRPAWKERCGFCHVFEQIGEKFGESDLGVCTSFPFRCHSILTRRPFPLADPNRLLLAL